MSTVAPPQTKLSSKRRTTTKAVGHGSSDALIAKRIADAQTALWRAELSRALLIPVVATLVLVTLWAVIDQWVWSPGKLVRFLALVGGVAAIAAWVTKRIWPLMWRQIRPEYAAQSLEHDLPELRHSLTSYVSLREDQNREGVRGVVVRSIGVRAAGQLQHHDLEIPSEAAGNLYWWLGVAGAIALAAAYSLLSPKNTLQSTKRLLLPLASIQAPSRVNISDVLPGDVEVLAGRPFDVSAMVDGLAKTDQALVEFGSGFVSSKPLEIQSDTGRHSAAITVDSATSYRIVAGDTVAGPFSITTRKVPSIQIDNVEITPPAYTHLPVRSTSGGAIVAEENSLIKITATAKESIDRARIEFNPRAIGDKVQASGGIIEMQIANAGAGISASFPLRLPANGSGAVAVESYRIHVWDSAGIENPDPIVYPVRIVADLAPEITITSPQAPLTEVPINGAQKIEVHALDPDYGLKQIVLQIRRGVDTLKTETLWSSTDGQRGNQTCIFMLLPESIGLRIGETVQVVAIANDNRHDSNGNAAPNVITSDKIELKVIARQADSSKLPKFDNPSDKAKEQSKDGKQGEDQMGEGENETGQSGAGASGEGNSGAGKSGQGQSGSGSAKKQDGEKGDGKGDSGDGESGEGEKGSGKGNSGSSGESSAADDASESGERSGDQAGQENAAGKSAGGKAGDTKLGQDEKGAGQAGQRQKPQHDGDAFERIRDFINQSKDGSTQPGEQSNDKTDEQKQDQASSSGSAKGTDDKSGMKPSANEGKSDKSNSKSDGEKQLGSESIKNGKGESESDSQGQPKPDANKNQAGKNGDSPSGKKSDPGVKSESGKPSETGGDAIDPTNEKSADKGSDTGTESDQNNGSQSGEGQPSASSSKSSDKPDGGKNGKESPGRNDGMKGDQGGQPKDGDQAKNGETKGDGEGGKNGQPSDKNDGRSDPKAGDGKGQPSGSSTGDANSKSAQPANQTNPSGSVSTGGADSGDSTGAESIEVVQHPDAVDVEHARKATDLVLKYLNSQREKPDPELLQQLDWTPDELRAFADRWNRIRNSEQNPTADAKQIEEALRSLGIRSDQRGPIGRAGESKDELRGLKDAGNRTPAPAIHRDAFDAFRRNANRK